MNLVAC